MAALTIVLCPVASAIADGCETPGGFVSFGIQTLEVDGQTARISLHGVDCPSPGFEDCFKVGFSAPVGASLVVDWGDSQSTQLASSTCSTFRQWPAQDLSHAYDRPGRYRVRLLLDGEQLGPYGEQEAIIAGPPASIEVKRSADDPQRVTFTALGQHPSGRPISKYEWDFGDGAHAEGATPTHRYDDTARHAVRLKITDDAGDTHEVTTDLDACTDEVHAGPFSIQGCVYDLEDRWVAVGEFNVNGLAAQSVGASIIKQPLTLELKRGTKLLLDDTVVFDSEDTRMLPADLTYTPPQDLRIKGVPVSGQARLRFTAEDGGSALLDFNVDVAQVIPTDDLLKGLGPDPQAFLSPAGSLAISVRASIDHGIRLDSARVSGDRLTFGPVKAPFLLRRFNLAYRLENGEHVFEGEAGLGAPLGPLYGARATIRNGRLAKIGGFLDDANVAVPPPAPPGVFWQGGSLDFTLLPSFAVTGQTRLSAGPSVQGLSLLSVTGAVTFALNGTCPRRSVSGPTVLAEGTGQLVLLRGRRVYTCYTAEGNLISAGGDLAYSLGGWKLRTSVDGFLDGTRAATLTGAGSLTVPLGDDASAQSSARYVVSDVGVAGCSERRLTFEPPAWKGKYGSVKSAVASETSVRLGIAWRWGEPFPQLGCDLARFTTVRARLSASAHSAAVAPVDVHVPGGQRGIGFAVTGQDGAPLTTLTAPDGTRIRVDPERGAQRGAGWFAFADRPGKTTYILVAEPPSGAWGVSVSGDRIRSIQRAAFLPPAAVTGTITRSGADAALSWNADAPPGQTLRFYEEGDGIARAIGRGSGARGRLTFAPVSEPGANHRVTVVVEQDGLPRERMDVAPIPTPDALGAAGVTSIRPSSARIASAKRRSRVVTVTLRNPNALGVTTVVRLIPTKAGRGARLFLAPGERRIVRLALRPGYRHRRLRIVGTTTAAGRKLARVSRTLEASR